MIKRKVLFVCVQNTARSRMAEALLQHLAGERFDVSSAGYESTEANPTVVAAMASAGVPLASTVAQATVFDLFKAGRHFHYVISVCDEAHGEKCPLFPGVVKRISWSFPDPKTFRGNPAERLARISQLRDAIRARLETWIGELEVEPSP